VIMLDETHKIEEDSEEEKEIKKIEGSAHFLNWVCYRKVLLPFYSVLDPPSSRLNRFPVRSNLLQVLQFELKQLTQFQLFGLNCRYRRSYPTTLH
jgi:hypothetical protein